MLALAADLLLANDATLALAAAASSIDDANAIDTLPSTMGDDEDSSLMVSSLLVLLENVLAAVELGEGGSEKENGASEGL